MDGTLDDTDEDWQRKRMQEAAAVLEVLVNASLMLTPVDVDALRYIWATAASIQVGHSKWKLPWISMLECCNAGCNMECFDGHYCACMQW